MAFINVQTFNGKRRLIADVEGHFAIHPAVWGCTEKDRVTLATDVFVVTHVGTGLAFISGTSLKAALAARAAINSNGLNWTLPKGAQSLTADHKLFGQKVRQQFDGKDHAKG